jgi:hypothetical protein
MDLLLLPMVAAEAYLQVETAVDYMAVVVAVVVMEHRVL